MLQLCRRGDDSAPTETFSFPYRAWEETSFPTWMGLTAGCFSSIILSPSS